MILRYVQSYLNEAKLNSENIIIVYKSVLQHVYTYVYWKVICMENYWLCQTRAEVLTHIGYSFSFLCN